VVAGRQRERDFKELSHVTTVLGLKAGNSGRISMLHSGGKIPSWI
jgi:hypothetical protein